MEKKLKKLEGKKKDQIILLDAHLK